MRIEKLEDELNDIKEQHTRELMILQQEIYSQKAAYEDVIKQLRFENYELTAFKSSIALHINNESE